MRIQASHQLTELAEELRASEARRYEKIEQARDAARRPQPDAQAEVQPGTGGGGPAPPPAKKAPAKSATSRPLPPQVPKPKPAPAPPPPPPPAALPPGARIMMPEEMAAIDHLLQTHPETRHLFEETR